MNSILCILCVVFLLLALNGVAGAQVIVDDPIPQDQLVRPIEGAVFNGDHIYFSWPVSAQPYVNIMFARCTEGGRKYEEPRTLHRVGGLGDRPIILRAQDDFVHVVFKDLWRSIYHCRSADRGGSFRCAEVVQSSLSQIFDVRFAVSGPYAHLAWDDRLTDSPTRHGVFIQSFADYGERFVGDFTIIDPQRTIYLSDLVASEDSLYVLWRYFPGQAMLTHSTITTK